MGDLKPYRGNYYLWYYIPSLPAAIIFLIVLIVATTLHNSDCILWGLWVDHDGV